MTEWLNERRIRCPFCGEAISITIDLSAESQSYVEDCQVCCQPMQISVLTDNGELVSVNADR